MEAPKRYHPLHVTLHWLVAIFVTLNLAIGNFVFPNRDYPEMAAAVHMAAGIAVLALIIVRFVVRLRVPRPADAESGSKLTDWLARFVHYSLYVVLFIITAVGLTFSIQGGRFARTFLGAEPVFGRPSEIVFLLRGVHGMVANVLLALVVLHLLAAAYHQFIRRDNLLARMWYGRR